MWLLTRVPATITLPSATCATVVTTPWASLKPCMPVLVTKSSSTSEGGVIIAGAVPAELFGPDTLTIAALAWLAATDTTMSMLTISSLFIFRFIFLLLIKSSVFFLDVDRT
ncbi:MAG: hypothetical protein ACFFCW_48115 [Candidatus Hodarchaeota archaeon]